MSIIDVAGGAQPMSNEDGRIWVTYNGEIYNYLSLSRGLAADGHEFRTRADTEVLVHGYEKWADDVVQHLNGIFAFCLWDAGKQLLLLARDHFGVKPLYYHDNGSRLVFGSELKAILQYPGIAPEVDPSGLDDALVYGFVPAPRTLFRGIRKLGPGCRLIARDGKAEVERYWQPVPQKVSVRDEHSLIAGIRSRIEAAVERQMMSDVPVGALLSGGVDSTAVVSLMRRHSETVRTFSIGVRGEDEINELPAARETARRLRTQHEEIEIGAQDYMDLLERAHYFLEEPATPSSLLTFFVCRLAQSSVKVVLTGQGADELFGGYSRYFGERFRAAYAHLPGVVRNRLVPFALEALPSRMRWQRGAYALAADDTIERFKRIYEVFSDEERRRLRFGPSAAEVGSRRDTSKPIRDLVAGIGHLDSLDQLLYVDLRCNLSDNLLMFGDKMSMAASVEARVPMLDLDLTGFVEEIPASLKLKRGRLKYLHKRAAEAWVPREVLHRPKLGFQIPEARWFRGSMLGFTREALTGRDARVGQFLDRDLICGMLDAHQGGTRNLWRQLFSLLSIEMVYRQFIPSS